MRQHEQTGVHKVILAKLRSSPSSCFSSVLAVWLAHLFSWLLHATSTPLASTAGSIIKTIMLESVYQIPIYSPITHLLLYCGWEMGRGGNPPNKHCVTSFTVSLPLSLLKGHSAPEPHP